MKRTGRWGRGVAIACGFGATVAGGAASVTAQNGGTLLERPALLELEAETALGDALRALRTTSGVALAFSPDLLPEEHRAVCACRDVTVAVALDRLLRGTGLEYRDGGRQILIGRAAAATVPRARALVGVVVDASTGRPIAGAEVRRAGGGTPVLTGDDGRFYLRGADDGPHEVRVSALGYEAGGARVEGTGEVARVELMGAPIPLSDVIIAPGRFGVLEVTPGTTGSVVSREDIEAIPQFGDDVFRTLKRMPGVAAEDISTRLNVRGGTDRDLLVRLDGVELFEPYHLKDLDGALGIIDVQSLGGVDLVTGGFPAEYGDKTAGVFEMHTRQPPSTGTRTTLGLSLSSASAISQGSFGEGRGQWLLSLRRGFLEYALAVTGVDDELDPRYWDALAKVQYLTGERHLVWAETLHGGDELHWTDEASLIDSDWANGYGWLGWKATWTASLRSETVLSTGRLTRNRFGSIDDPGGGAFSPIAAEVDDRSRVSFAGARQDWELDLNGWMMLKAGLEVRREWADYDYDRWSDWYDLSASNQLYVRSDTAGYRVDPRGSELGAYGALRGRLGSDVTWEAGVRRDWQEHTGDVDWAPRLLARWDVGDRTSLRGSWGRYFQSHALHELRVHDGETSFASSERAEQVALGIERRFGAALSARLEAYRRSISDPLPTYVNLARDVNPILEVQTDRVRLQADEARARGIEAILAYDGTGVASWSVSYALARAEDRIGGTWAPRTLDQLHTLNLRGALRLGTGWQVSGAWSYHSGWPYTDQFIELDLALSEDGTEQVEILRRGFGPYNAERLPAYHRLDVRLTRVFELSRSRLELYLDVFNAYDRTNLRGYQWSLRRIGNSLVTRRTTGEEQLPLLPTIGLRWVF